MPGSRTAGGGKPTTAGSDDRRNLDAQRPAVAVGSTAAVSSWRSPVDEMPRAGRRAGLIATRQADRRSCSRTAAIDSIRSKQCRGGSGRRECVLPGANAMATAGISARNLSDAEHSAQLRRAVVASTVGSVIESYDFLLYVLIAPLVFAKLYFPSSDPLVGTLQAFGIYAVGFIARPVGAAFFGHYGDRIGRKATLIATLLLTGLSTFAVGFVPSYAQIGIWGAVILTIVRFIQGVGVGGEWGGSVLMSMEWTKTNAHRGFAASWPQFGVPA